MASLFPLTPYTALRSHSCVALSSVTAKSIIMIPYILHFVNVQLHRRGCTVFADGIVQPTATRVFNFKRPGCSTGALYSEYPFGSIKRLDKYDKGAVSTLYLCFDANEEIMDSDFIMWYFESSRWHNGVREICAEGARNHGLLNVPTAGFFDTVHYLPSNKAEQKRIVAFLSTIDERYTRAFSELEELNNLKNGLYQRLFI